ncbi:MAG TPA: YceI family protein [Rhizomicrobium sp.]
MKAGSAVAFLTLLAAADPASAAHWSVDYSHSRLGFAVQWSHEPFSAVFKRWNADIDFDPGDLAHARVAVIVDLASETSVQPDFDSGLKGAEGFQTSQFPAARFVATNIVRTSANAYEARGALTLHGVTRAIALPFTLAIAGRTAHMEGTAQVLRTDFGVGQNAWSASTPVSHDVKITVDLAATR